METFYIQIPSGKRDFFLNLMKELSFVKISESEQEILTSDLDYINAILESEEDIEQGQIITHTELKKEVQLWLK